MYRLMEADSLQTSVDLYKKNEIVYKEEIEELKTSNQNLSKAVTEAKSNSSWNEFYYLLLGVVATSAVVYVNNRK